MLIQLFLKAPAPGTVKTRLGKTLGDEKACEIYKQLVAHQLKNLPAEAGLEIHFAPAKAGTAMQDWLGKDLTYLPQCEGNLGDRLRHAVFSAFERGESQVFCIGSDCPALEASHFQKAENFLSSGADVVFGPTFDGGYYLIGMTAAHACLFEGIPWSTEETLQTSLKHAQAAGLKTTCLETLSDVDEEEDWLASLTLLTSDTE